MNKKLITRTIATIFLLLAIGDVVFVLESRGVETQPAVTAQVGKPAPDFTAKDSNGKEHQLSHHKGKMIVLEWVNYDCPFVKKHYDSGNMQALQKKYAGKGVLWFSINSSAPGRQGNFEAAQVNKLIGEKGAKPTAYLFDPEGTVGKQYGAKSTPTMFIIDPKGVLIYAGAIDDKATTEQADVKGAKNYVQNALDSALAGKPVQENQTQAYGCGIKYAAKAIKK